MASQEYESAQSHQVCRGVSHVQTFSHEVHHAFDHRVGHDVSRDVSHRVVYGVGLMKCLKSQKSL